MLGPPRGAGELQGSFDVVSLGNNGVIVVAFDQPVICDGPGADFTVFENAFHNGSPSGPIFAEYGIVAVSQDGTNFFDLPYDVMTHTGLAGQTPVLSNPDNGIDPLDPSVSGGDTFDLASVGLAWAAYVRITDPGASIPDPGNMIPPGTSAGFDLDAIAALHACDPGAMPSPTPTHTEVPATLTSTPTRTATATWTAAPTTPASSHDAAVVAHRPVKVRIGKGSASASKRVRVKVRNADASGILPIQLTATGCGPVTAASVDFDRRTAGAQDTISVKAGKAKTAVVTLEVSAALVTTPDRRTPAQCSLTFSAAAAVPGNVDPSPSDNSISVDLSVLDRNDVHLESGDRGRPARSNQQGGCNPATQIAERSCARARRFAPTAGGPPAVPGWWLLQLIVLVLSIARSVSAQDPFVDSLVSFTPGDHAGFGADQLPGIVLGPPRGSGPIQGSFDVVSLGNNGTIVVGFDLPVICDGAGPDFTVFENAFTPDRRTGRSSPTTASSPSARTANTSSPALRRHLAHRSCRPSPVFSNPDNDIDPLDPSVSGGDVYDLAATGLTWAAYVRITDPGASIPDPGNLIPQADNSGFDLDAIAALHACDPSAMPSATPTPTSRPNGDTPTATATARAAVATPTPTSALTTATATAVANTP